MYPMKYLVIRPDSDGGELFWSGQVGKSGQGQQVDRTDEAKAFDSAEEAYQVVGVLVQHGYLPKTWLASRVGKRYIADETNVVY